MSAAGLPVCLTRPPKLVLHPPPVSKSEIKSIPGVSNTSRKTTRKQAKKGIGLLILRGTRVKGLGPSLGSATITKGQTHSFTLCAFVSASAKWAQLVPVPMTVPKWIVYESDGDAFKKDKNAAQKYRNIKPRSVTQIKYNTEEDRRGTGTQTDWVQTPTLPLASRVTAESLFSDLSDGVKMLTGSIGQGCPRSIHGS